MIEHTYKTKDIVSDHKILISQNILEKEYLNPYEKKIPLKINGKLIPFEDIYSVKISSTLLLDDEIELFAMKNNFSWIKIRDEKKFILFCLDETDNLLKNPYLFVKKTNVIFVDPIRINELKAIKNNSFDLTKLICLCEELNNATQMNNNISSSMLQQRAIIDHTPPIFEYNTFSQFANNYREGSKSFKKAMMILDNSLRNIADNNIHSQVRGKEVLPTAIQVQFHQEIDLLLSEVVRKLK